MMLENLLSWSLQVLAIAAAGTLLPWVFRVRDPRWRPRYYQALLLLCPLLPAVQPWRRETLAAAPGYAPAAPAVPTSPVTPLPAPALPFTAAELALGVFAAGVLLRAAWLGIGLLRLDRYRRHARPLYPLPGAVETARQRIGADALICVAPDSTGPVTFGLHIPVVLFPKSFLDLPHDAQLAIACHELLHVRHRDWAQHIVEELVSLVLWFHPAVWWLVSRIRLAREQAVDHEVVQLTRARGPYVDALLAMSGARPSLDLAPAPLFLRRRHLVHRISSLVKEVSMSRTRLVSSYVSLGAVLAAAVWMGSVAFPLRGAPQTPADAEGVTVVPGAPILHRAGVAYPVDARRGGIAGTVTLDLSVDAQGSVTDARAIAGPQQLRKPALESALQWHYAPNTGSPIRATIDFNPPPAEAESPRPSDNTPQGVLGRIDYGRVKEPLQSLVRARIGRYEGQPVSEIVKQEIAKALEEVDPHVKTAWLRPSAQSMMLVLYGPSDPPNPEVPSRIRIGGNVQRAKLVNQVAPVYPPEARAEGIQGAVTLAVLIDQQGRVKDIAPEAVRGHPLLVQAARDAVQQWTWQPTLLNGNPVEVATQVELNFTLSR